MFQMQACGDLWTCNGKMVVQAQECGLGGGGGGGGGELRGADHNYAVLN